MMVILLDDDDKMQLVDTSVTKINVYVRTSTYIHGIFSVLLLAATVTPAAGDDDMQLGRRRRSQVNDYY